MSKNLDIKIRETKDLERDDLLWSRPSRRRSSSLIKVAATSLDVTWCGGKLWGPRKLENAHPFAKYRERMGHPGFMLAPRGVVTCRVPGLDSFTRMRASVRDTLHSHASPGYRLRWGVHRLRRSRNAFWRPVMLPDLRSDQAVHARAAASTPLSNFYSTG